MLRPLAPECGSDPGAGLRGGSQNPAVDAAGSTATPRRGLAAHTGSGEGAGRTWEGGNGWGGWKPGSPTFQDHKPGRALCRKGQRAEFRMWCPVPSGSPVSMPKASSPPATSLVTEQEGPGRLQPGRQPLTEHQAPAGTELFNERSVHLLRLH